MTSDGQLALQVQPVCGELLLIARLNNSSTHEKRPKAYAEPKAAGLSGEGG
jgi:hypothetical protein